MNVQKRRASIFWSLLDGCSRELGINEEQLISILRINNLEFQSWKTNEEVAITNERPSDRILAIIDIYDCLTSFYINEDDPAKWLSQINPENQLKLYKERCPLDVMLQDDDGVFKTVEYLRMMMRGP